MEEHPTATPSRAASMARHPAGSARPVADRDRAPAPDPEEGSLVTEYGLLAVVSATIAGVVIAWASNGALVSLFNALLRHARGLVGA